MGLAEGAVQDREVKGRASRGDDPCVGSQADFEAMGTVIPRPVFDFWQPRP